MSAVDDLLEGLDAAERALLQHVREVVTDEIVRTSGREVREVLSYNLPAFAIERAGKQVIVGGFAAGKRFCSWYPFSGQTLARCAGLLGDFECTKGSVHFTSDHPLPDETLRALVRARLAEIDERGR